MSLSNSLTIDDLRGYFHLPIVEVAKQLGTCTTALKKICRKHKIRKWPYRQIRSLTKSIQSLEMASLNDTMGDDVRDQYREQIVTLQKAIDDIVCDPNTNISALAKKLEAEWGSGGDDRMLDSEPSDNVRQIIQAAAATVGVEGAKNAPPKRKLSQMEAGQGRAESSHSSGGSSQQAQTQGAGGGQEGLGSSQGQSSSGGGGGLYSSLLRPSIPKKMPEVVSIGLTQVNQVALSMSDSKSTSIHFVGPVVLAPLERRRISKHVSKKLVPLIEPDICNHFKMEFLPQGPLLQVKYCQPNHESTASSAYSYHHTADPKATDSPPLDAHGISRQPPQTSYAERSQHLQGQEQHGHTEGSNGDVVRNGMVTSASSAATGEGVAGMTMSREAESLPDASGAHAPSAEQQ